MPPKDVILSLSPDIAGSKLVRRGQPQTAVSGGTLNAIIAVTVIFGVIFIAFALTVIYWRYMAKIDREERERHARMEMRRKAKIESSNPSLEQRQPIANVPRPQNANGRSHGTCWSDC